MNLLRKNIEYTIQQRLANELNGEIETLTPVGKIDLETDDEVIEIKAFSKWKHAIGQIQSYNFYKNKTMRIHLFYTNDKELIKLPRIQEVCKLHDIRCTTEKCAF